MINFKAVELADKPWIDRLNHASDSKSADYSFTTLFVWRDTYLPHIAQVGGRILVISGQGHDLIYAYPAGDGPLHDAIDCMIEDAAARGIPFRMRGVTTGMMAELDAMYPNRFVYAPVESEYDYIYRAESLATLAGKKLHAKRNHINRFSEQHDWKFVPLSGENLELCREICEKWFRSNPDTVGDNFTGEPAAIRKTLDNFDALGVEGGLIIADGRPVAFTIGEVLCHDTYLIHFEKADAEMQGAYAMINREFARYVRERHRNVVFINREEDMGLENLRKAKQSYYPEFMVKKFVAVLQ